MRVTLTKAVKPLCIAALCGALTACDSDFDDPVDQLEVSNGTADFSRFVAIGDSLTAGFADGTLYISSQENAFPAIIARQLAEAGGGAFTQPLMNDNNGGLLLGGEPLPGFGTRLILSGTPPAPVALSASPTTDVSAVLTGPFNNVGVPGAKSFHLGLDGYGDIAGLQTFPATANPYFVRFASAPTTSMIADAIAQNPTFFFLWIGNNDTLSYASGGGVGVDQLGNADPTTYGAEDITDPATFAAIYSTLAATLTAGGASGVIANLPNVTAIPFFTTVPFNPLPMDADTAAASNAAYATYNAGIAAAPLSDAEKSQRTISFSAGLNALVILDESLTDLSEGGLPSIRQATASDFVLLPSSARIGTEAIEGDPTSIWGVGTPMADEDVLTEAEAALVAAANAAFNETIAAVAAANDQIALFDASGEFDRLAAGGINYGSGAITTDFVSGGAFSLDGVHPTARGHAVLANLIMDVIEQNFAATLRPVDPGAFTTVFFE